MTHTREQEEETVSELAQRGCFRWQGILEAAIAERDELRAKAKARSIGLRRIERERDRAVACIERLRVEVTRQPRSGGYYMPDGNLLRTILAEYDKEAAMASDGLAEAAAPRCCRI